MKDQDFCQSCGSEIRGGLLNANPRLSVSQIEAVNLAYDRNLSDVCNKCPDLSLGEAPYRLIKRIAECQNSILAYAKLMPILSIHQPHGWDYDCIGLVTAQTTTGTGMFSDVASAFTDLFGAQSKTYNSKIKSGEEMCKAALRAQAVEVGGNAIIGVDVDYAEVGGQRAMLMVCMTGTAVRLKNVECHDTGLDESVAGFIASMDLLGRLEKARASLI